MDIELTTLLFRSLLIQNKRGCVQSQSLRSTQFGALDNIIIFADIAVEIFSPRHHFPFCLYKVRKINRPPGAMWSPRSARRTDQIHFLFLQTFAGQTAEWGLFLSCRLLLSKIKLMKIVVKLTLRCSGWPTWFSWSRSPQERSPSWRRLAGVS